MPFTSYSQVSPGDVIRFGPRQRWGLVNKISSGDPPRWELIWVYGNGMGRREVVSPDERAVYVSMNEDDAQRERAKLLPLRWG